MYLSLKRFPWAEAALSSKSTKNISDIQIKMSIFFKFTYRSNVSKIRHSFSIVTLVKKKTIITTVKKNASLTLKITAKCPIQSYSVFRTWRRIRHLLCLL